jgi:hypothetical protein
MVYEVGCVIAAARTLLDTGAAPSLVTTGFLELVPRDCVIDRDRLAVVGRVLGADGQPLRMEGTVSMAFDLDGQPCRADFVVAVGKPSMILGNDFLDPRQAVVHMNADGEGGGYVDLVSKSATGHPIHHRAAVSTSPSATVVASVSLADPTGQGPSVPVGPDVQPPEPTGATAATPLPAAKLAADALADGEWKLERGEHLLYSNQAIEMPPRSKVTTLLRAPQELRSKTATCLVDYLPARPGLDEPPHVIPRAAPIENGFIEVQLVKSSPVVTAVRSSPVARP